MKRFIIILLLAAVVLSASSPAFAFVEPRVGVLDLLWWLRDAGLPFWPFNAMEQEQDWDGAEVPWGSGSDGWA